jgi:hypothetical protein
VQVFHSLYTFLVEGASIRGGMEVKVSTKYLVASFATEDHLHTHGLDLATEEIHRRRSADGCHIVCFKMVDDLGKGIQPFLHSENVFMMNCAQEMGGFTSSEEVRGILKSN